MTFVAGSAFNYTLPEIQDEEEMPILGYLDKYALNNDHEDSDEG